MINSKYVGKTYGKWTVERVTRTPDNHLRFTLMRLTHDGAYKYITLRDNALTKISRGERTVESYAAGKEFQRKRLKQNTFRNNVFYVFN